MDKKFNRKDFQRKYLIAMGIIAMLAISAFISMEWILRSQSDFSSLINISGRQRMLSQRLALLGEQLLEHGQNSKIEAKLRHDLNLFESSHLKIVSGTWNSPKRALSRGAHEIYFGKIKLDEQVKRYIEHKKNILARNKKTQFSFEELDHLLHCLDLAVKQFEVESKSFTNQLFEIELVLVVSMLVTISLIIVFIFAPLSRFLESIFSQLEREKQEAIAAKELKSKFMANITHELRTPLNGIIGATQLIDKEKLSDKERGHLTIIENCAFSNLLLVNDLLDFEKMQNNNFSITKSWTRLESILDEIERLFKSMAEKKSINFSVIAKLEQNSVMTDGNRLKQILSNLISNGIKFTQEGSVTLEVKQNQSEYEFIITDSGMGISPDELELIFDDFYQTNESQKLAIEGTGLGLSIVKALVELLGGNISVTSELGRGSVFTLKFKFESKENSNDFEFKDLSNMNKKVLLLEDNKTNQIIFSRYLEKLKINFKIVANGEEGLKACQEEDFDIIFSDIQMPFMGGEEFLAEYKKLSLNNQAKVIAFTANSSAGDIAKYKSLGFDAVLSKPLTIKELKLTISENF